MSVFGALEEDEEEEEEEGGKKKHLQSFYWSAEGTRPNSTLMLDTNQNNSREKTASVVAWWQTENTAASNPGAASFPTKGGL